MAALDRFRRRPPGAPRAAAPAAASLGTTAEGTAVDAAEESRLWALLKDDPNDVEAFHRLADVVRRKAAEGHADGDQLRAMDDAVWSLAEELAHSGHAWYPLVELARLSVHDDRGAALRRLGTAAERDPSGNALATGLAMLRRAGLPGDALGLGVGHWRPRDHDVEAGRQLVEAAVEAGRVGEARRHLQALALHPDQGRVTPVRAELERLIAATESGGGSARPGGRGAAAPAAARAGAPGDVWSQRGPTLTTGPGTGGLPVLDPPPERSDVIDLREADLREAHLREAHLREAEGPDGDAERPTGPAGRGGGGLLDRFRRR